MGLVSSIYSGEKAPPVSGRKDSSGQEEKLEPTKVKDRWKELMVLRTKAAKAAADLSAAIKAVAKSSGFNAKAIRNGLNARYEGDDAAKRMRRDAEQLQILID